MLRLLSSGSPALFILVAACTGATFGWRPTLFEVPDSTPVRIAVEGTGLRMSGRAVDWQRGTPRVVTTPGDTMVVPAGARLQARLTGRMNTAVVGAQVGSLVGVVATFYRCGGIDAACSEQDPTALLSFAAGALIGALFKTTTWFTVRRDTLTSANPNAASRTTVVRRP